MYMYHIYINIYIYIYIYIYDIKTLKFLILAGAFYLVQCLSEKNDNSLL